MLRPQHLASTRELLHVELVHLPLAGGATLTAAKPTCARCGTLVHVLRLHSEAGHLTLTAFCHGRRDTLRVPQRLLSTGARVELGLAFAHEARRGATPPHRLPSNT